MQICDAMKRMARKNKKEGGEDWKFAGFSLLLLVCFTLLVYNKTFSSMKLYIDDKDPYSYAGVIPPMFIIMLLFFYRKDLEVDRNTRKFLLSLPFFAVSAALLFIAGSFPDYALDRLSIPFFASGAILILFSIPTLKKLLFPVLYLFLFWTPLFQPVASMQTPLTNFTSDVVAIPVNLSGLAIEREGNTFNSQTQGFMEVVSECVALSSLIALFCFLLPFAYLARGNSINKFVWLVLWIIIAWVLDVVRILIVLLIWYNSGVSSALQAFHSLGWNILFDITLIAALVSIAFFRLFGIELKL
jgi:exosortase